MSEKNSFSILIFVFGIALFFSYHIYYHFISSSDSNLVKNYYKDEIEEKNEDIQIKKVSNKVDESKEKYLGIISIPKINLKTGFYNKNSSKNNVERSVTILNESIMPSENNSIVYLAAHSGYGYLAYFKDINKLTNEDMIYLNYKNELYSYIITEIYEMPRNGSIMVDRNINDKYLVLTTCSNNKNMQLVIISKLINKV